MRYLLLSLAAVGALASATTAAPIYSDDFSEPNGTLINGKAADVGGAWNVLDGAATLAVSNGTLNTSGGARTAFAPFTRALQAGEVLTISFNVGPQNPFSAGFAGVALYSGYVSPTSPGQERAFIGDINGITTAYAALGNSQTIQSSNSNLTAALKLTYNFDTGAASFFIDNALVGSAAFSPNGAINVLRINNNGGGDIQVDNLLVDVVPVPEPTTLGLLGLAGVGLLRRRRD